MPNIFAWLIFILVSYFSCNKIYPPQFYYVNIVGNSYLKRVNTDIAFIQETHLTDQEHRKLKREWVGQVYYSPFSSSGRGVALLIHKKLQFNLINTHSDNTGRYVIVEC